MRSLRYHGQNLMGLLNKAKNVIFDNTNTKLSASNVQDAIYQTARGVNLTSQITYLNNIEAVDVSLVVFGRLAVLNFRLNKLQGSANSWVSILKVPQSVTPSHQVFSIVEIVNNRENVPVSFSANNETLSLKTKSAISSDTEFYGTVVWTY